MNECVVLKTSDLIKAWDNACREAKYVLESLYPDDLPPKAKEEDITSEIEFKWQDHSFFVIKYLGREIARQRARCKIDEDGYLTIQFRITERGYRFEVNSFKNWCLIKVVK